MQNVQKYAFTSIIIAISSSIATYAWNNQTLSEMVEEHNRQVLENCLTKARIQKTAKEILEYASNCNKDILTNISTPRSVETITWTHSTGNTVQPLWFQLIPTAEAKSVESASKELQIKNTKVSTTHSTIWDTNTWNVRTPKQIYEQVKHLGYREAPTISVIQSCKESSLHPDHCILIWLTLMYNEAGNQQNSKACTTRNNCFGINSWKKVYASLDEWMENWVQKYNLWWYKAESPSFFYSSAWKLSPSRYCVSEESSNTEIGCPQWLSIATTKWKQLKLILNNGN